MSKCGVVLLLLLLYSTSIFCDTCLTFDFENGLDGYFSNEGICTGLEKWLEVPYSSFPVVSPHQNSENAITPSSDMNCIKSFAFEISPIGVFEVNIYMESANNIDRVSLLVQEIVEGGNDAIIGDYTLFPALPGFVNGWHTVRIPTTNAVKSNGYITIMGIAAPESIVLVDSFRYFTTNEEYCLIYETEDHGPTTDYSTIGKDTTAKTPTDSITPTESKDPTHTTEESTIEETNTTEPTTLTPQVTTVEVISSTESTTTTTYMPTTTTDFITEDTDSGDNVITTEDPDTEKPNDNSFWTPFTITVTVLIFVILVVVIACICK